MQADGRVIARLTKLIPELEYARETHVCWSTTTDAALAANPQIGSREFHRGCIAEYDERLAAIREAITELLAIAEAAEDLRADAMRWRWARDMATQEDWQRMAARCATRLALDRYAETGVQAAALSTVAPVREG